MILLPLSSKWLGLQVYASTPRFNCFTNLFIYVLIIVCVCTRYAVYTHEGQWTIVESVLSLNLHMSLKDQVQVSRHSLVASLLEDPFLLALTCLILYFCFV